MRLGRLRALGAGIAAAAALGALAAPPAQAQTQRNAVLILGDTVSGGTNSLEAQAARNAGMEVDVVTGTTWRSMTQAQFDSYRALVLGDPGFAYPGTYDAAAANAATWGPIIDGNAVIIGTDPVDHQYAGSGALVQKGVAYAVDDAPRTGLYFSLSDAYDGTSANTPLPMLYGLEGGTEFRIQGAGCYEQAHIIVEHPVIDQLTDAMLSNWGCSVHNTFTSYPAGFIPLAIARGQGSYVAPDGTVGLPYILARGRTTTLLGRSLVAIGDSVSAGEGIAEGWVWHPEGESDGQWEQDGPSVPWDTTFTTEFCHQTPQAHPRVLAAKTNALLTHLSCTGSKVGNGVLGIREDKGEWKAPDQLDTAMDNPFDAALPDIVTISLGANDISFADVVTDCIKPHPKVSVSWTGVHFGDGDCEYSDEEMDARFAAQRTGLRSVINEVNRRGQAAGKMPVIALTQYADPFPLEWTDKCPDLDIPFPGVTLSRDEVEFMRAGLVELNTGIATVAGEYANTVVVAPPPEYGEHRFCTQNPWTHGASLVFDKGLQGFHEGWEIGISKTPFHPTVEGQEAIADALLGPVVNKVLVRTGTNVTARTPGGPQARFATVTTQGGFTANPLTPGSAPVPSAFLMRQAWDLTAALIFSGPVTVYLPAQPGDSVWHYTDGQWVQLPTTYSGGYAIATVDHLSPFAVGPRVAEVSAAITAVDGGQAPHDVAFDATGSSVAGGGAIASYTWDFGDGGTATGATPTHRFDQSGTYDVKVRVKSAAGAVDEATTSLTVTNPAPVAAISGPSTGNVGEPVTFSSAGSSDNGSISEIGWYFGDETPRATGAEVTHTFTAPGTYTVGVVVQDDEGKSDMRTHDIRIDGTSGPTYAFDGFLQPVDNRPTVNTVKGGQAVPVKFRLGGDFGLDVLAAGFPQSRRIDCASGAVLDAVETTMTAGSSSLQYDAVTDTYTYVWKTQTAWAGTCRRLDVGLDDGSHHLADFKIR